MFSVISKTDVALLGLGCLMILVPAYALAPITTLTNASSFAIPVIEGQTTIGQSVISTGSQTVRVAEHVAPSGAAEGDGPGEKRDSRSELSRPMGDKN